MKRGGGEDRRVASARVVLRLWAAALLALLPAAALAQHGHGKPSSVPRGAKTAILLPGLGSHRHSIETSSPEAQKFFDQGLTLVYGFNPREAVRSFERASALDSEAAMPHWGIALALAGNVNDPEPDAGQLRRANEEAGRALGLSSGRNDAEQAYARALASRFSRDPKADKTKLAGAYREAMRELSNRYPDDLDAATLYAEAALNVREWKLWRADGTAEEGSAEILGVLESVLKRDPLHIGANHYYVHALEASPHPERALPSADRLRTLVPGIGHLVHMPSHIDMRTGGFLDAEKANERAVEVENIYIAETGAQVEDTYLRHSLHFLVAAASMAGRHGAARQAAAELYKIALPEVPRHAYLEAAIVQPIFVALRFRRWEDVAAQPDPGGKRPLARSFWLNAHAVAAAAAGDLSSARRWQKAFARAVRDVPANAVVFENSATAVLALAADCLDARIAQARRDRKAAIANWRRAVERQDSLDYDEPPDWYYPVRESLGAAFLADGQAVASEKVFREDLDRNPRNPRSLLGLARSLEAQGKSADATWVQAQFEEAWKDADTKVTVGDL